MTAQSFAYILQAMSQINACNTLRAKAVHRLAAVAVWAALIVPAPAHATDALADFLQQQGLAAPASALVYPTAPALPIAPHAEPAEAAPAANADRPQRPLHSSLVVHALGFLGVPYRLGGNSAEEGFDCSGFVQAAFRQVMGLQLPRIAREQARATAPIERSELAPGDLVFFNTLGRRYSHVGIYIGDYRFVHSPRSGARIRIERMDVRFWATRFNGARRVPAEAATARAPAAPPVSIELLALR
ncbi:cell wall-associated hydrolase [Serpentinimonas raichei]|uniref:Cell wall-associated hydrolase n=2 Tax=Serpentinimonas raichei TaxID=1458425 RepID=A0A060NIU6_9BURK|nr:cell wall-associated hydrolase [Serpentinimonas raichei]